LGQKKTLLLEWQLIRGEKFLARFELTIAADSTLATMRKEVDIIWTAA